MIPCFDLHFFRSEIEHLMFISDFSIVLFWLSLFSAINMHDLYN